jgi:hypothetical protein
VIEYQTMADLQAAYTNRLGALDDVLRLLKTFELEPPVEDVLAMTEYVRTGEILQMSAAFVRAGGLRSHPPVGEPPLVNIRD